MSAKAANSYFHQLSRRPNSNSPLLRLPLELRIFIWRYLFNINGVLLCSTYSRQHKVIQQGKKSKTAALLQTCKQLYYETRPYFLALSRFQIESLEPMPGRMLRHTGRLLPLKKIKHLVIGPASRPDATLSQLIRNVDKYFPSLSVLMIRMRLIPIHIRANLRNVPGLIGGEYVFKFQDHRSRKLERAALKDRKRRPKRNCTTILVDSKELGPAGMEPSEWPCYFAAWMNLHEWILKMNVNGVIYEGKYEPL